MNKIKLSDDVIEQIKDFKYWELTEEQESLIDKLITDKELQEHYKNYGLCDVCKQLKIDYCCNYCIFQPNFKNWTSGNHNVDEFIQKAQLNAKSAIQIIEWIEYDKFEDVEYLAKGGFGTTFKAVWKDGPWETTFCNQREGETKVVLKCLHNSQDITADFLKELGQKLRSLEHIAYGLECIHNKGLIHHDFHCGNILSNFDEFAYVTDLGLCQPANVKSSQNSNKKIYGVLPYVAPEVLRGKEYTQKSDIYGFGIIAYEFCTGFPPYHDIAHDEFLAMKVCHGLRPKCDYKIPQLVVDVINQCWDANPLKRPNADELPKLFYNLFYEIYSNRVDSVIYKQVEEADEINKKSFSTVQSSLSFTSTLSYTTHPQAVYTSRLLDFKNLPEPKNADKNNDLLGVLYSDSLIMDFTELDINSKGNYFCV
ncbi:kinase-like domain-containing protein [Rhizophagus irregularis DAOM 181602=DAOM 197198]|nr:kinase-like domain-containing protein [Rhizophagus irregularis DAOM 181602=DAOM 197198]